MSCYEVRFQVGNPGERLTDVFARVLAVDADQALQKGRNIYGPAWTIVKSREAILLVADITMVD